MFRITFFYFQRHEVQEPDTSDFHVESLATVELSEIEPKLCKELQISPLEGGKNGNDYEAVHEQYEELKCQVKSLEVFRVAFPTAFRLLCPISFTLFPLE